MSNRNSRDARTLGVDACRKGWVGITSDLQGYFAVTIAGLVTAASNDGDLAVVAIDIPIGLPDSTPRQADLAARAEVGNRRSSVFATPIRTALVAETYAEATAVNLRTTGKGISRQAFGLREKVTEVDEWLKSAAVAVIEVHPELCFATMTGGHLQHPKTTWAGLEERRAALASVSIVLPSNIGIAGEQAKPDDVLDAAAAMWTAGRFLREEHCSYPDPPERFSDGHEAAIRA